MLREFYLKDEYRYTPRCAQFIKGTTMITLKKHTTQIYINEIPTLMIREMKW